MYLCYGNSRCIAQVLDCLDHIHSTNVIHRDLKVVDQLRWKNFGAWTPVAGEGFLL